MGVKFKIKIKELSNEERLAHYFIGNLWLYPMLGNMVDYMKFDKGRNAEMLNLSVYKNYQKLSGYIKEVSIRDLIEWEARNIIVRKN